MIALLGAVGIGVLPALVGSVSVPPPLTVDAGAVTRVSVDAPIFDERSTSPYGCPPAGCIGENTRVKHMCRLEYALLLYLVGRSYSECICGMFGCFGALVSVDYRLVSRLVVLCALSCRWYIETLPKSLFRIYT